MPLDDINLLAKVLIISFSKVHDEDSARLALIAFAAIEPYVEEINAELWDRLRTEVYYTRQAYPQLQIASKS